MEKLESIASKRKIRKIKRIARTINGTQLINPKRKRMRKKGLIIAYSILALMANQKGNNVKTKQMNVTFDTDSSNIGIDNRCWACISNDLDDFIGGLTETKWSIKGFGGSRVDNIMKGTHCYGNMRTAMGKYTSSKSLIHITYLQVE